MLVRRFRAAAPRPRDSAGRPARAAFSHSHSVGSVRPAQRQ